jgi:hypothetical protein
MTARRTLLVEPIFSLDKVNHLSLDAQSRAGDGWFVFWAWWSDRRRIGICQSYPAYGP